jgi:GAF domain-containing protein
MGRRAKPVKAKAAPKKEAARVQQLEKRLAASLEQQTATSEILRVIGRTQIDVQPVFDAILASAVRLLGAYVGALTRVTGDQIELAAMTSTEDAVVAVARALYPQSLQSAEANAQAIRARAPLNIADAYTDPRLPESAHAYARFRGFRSWVVVPMLRHDEAIGTIGVTRREPGGFTDDEIALLQTFADQAVIAIENARLLSELQAKNEALTQAHAQVSEALEQQTATSEILRVISRSQTDVQPVFDTIVRRTVRLCNARVASVILLVDETLHLVATHAVSPEWLELARSNYPQPLQPSLVGGLALLERRTIHVPDVETDERFPRAQQLARTMGYRSLVFVPMFNEGAPIGTISAAKDVPFSEREIDLLKTFADQAAIAVENVRLFTELQASNRELTTALDTQTATSDILRVISRSQTDVQPVFDAILASAIRLLGAYVGALTRVTGDEIELAAMTSTDDAVVAVARALYPQSLQSTGAHAQAIRARAPLNIADAYADPRLLESAHSYARFRGYRSQVVVPMLRHDEAIGTIGVTRREPGGFTDDEIALLQTFADQAVIAIENARLLSELQERNEALTQAHAQVTEALDQQTATSEILRVISSSPTDATPVFNAIVKNARRLLHAAGAVAFRRIGDEIHLAALTIDGEGHEEALTSGYPVPFRQMVSDNPVSARAWVGGEVGNIPDAVSDPRWPERLRQPVRTFGVHGLLIVPMRRDDIVLGVITVMRREPGPFSNDEIDLLKTFADQAVIAVENVRLFTELQTSNRELTTALDTQTATSDILRVISHSQRDVQPVFDAIVRSAVRLLRAYTGTVTRVAGDRIDLGAFTSTEDETDAVLRAAFPMLLHAQDEAVQDVYRARLPLNVADVETDPRVRESTRRYARSRGFRSWVVMPMLRHDEAIGAIGVTRRAAGGFTADEIALLKTFADQAVIAIENARLFNELQARTQDLTRSVDQLTALGDVGRAVSSSLDLDTVLTTIVRRAVQLSGADGGTIFEYDEGAEEFSARATLNADESQSALLRTTRLRRGEGAVGRLAVTREPIQIPDIAAEGAYESRLRGAMLEAGTRAVLAIPLLHEERIVGGLVVTRRSPGAFGAEVVEILRTFATQSALAIQNARLFHEIEVKSRELEVASQHKSEFLASMSHELRTPLNAIIGFSDVLLEGMFGETNEKQTEYLRDILASGQHLLSLINDILDLSKIEAGRMDLDVAAFDLPAAIDDALLLMRERAGRRGITLEHHVDARVGEVQGDQRKVKQVLLNLLSNAVKFTREGGRIDVRAGLANGTAEISVTDTGIGIAAEDHDTVFEEFRQVGAAEKKAEGTGLGLALCRKFVELHGGRIWVKSQVGAGSTFTFTLPLRPGV